MHKHEMPYHCINHGYVKSKYRCGCQIKVIWKRLFGYKGFNAVNPQR